MTDKLIVENARIVLRNFAGREGTYNAAGDRNFKLLLDEEMAVELEAEGWNVKRFKPKEDDDLGDPFLEVSVSYRNIPPRITMISGAGNTVLDEDAIDVLDFAEIANVDLIINPYEWDVNGKQGIKAYLKTMYVTIVEDEFASKYYDTPGGSDEQGV